MVGEALAQQDRISQKIEVMAVNLTKIVQWKWLLDDITIRDGALRACRCTNEELAHVLCELAGPQYIVHAMESHPNNPTIQQRGCLALTRLIEHGGRTSSDHIISAGGCGVVLSAMQNHIDRNALVLRSGFQTLWRLMISNALDASPFILTPSNVGMFLDALQKWTHIESLCAEACKLLHQLYTLENGRAMLKDNNKYDDKIMNMLHHHEWPDDISSDDLIALTK